MAKWMVGLVGCSPPPVTGFALEEPLQTDSDEHTWTVGKYTFCGCLSYFISKTQRDGNEGTLCDARRNGHNVVH